MDVLFLLDCSDAEANEDAWNSTLQFVNKAVWSIRPRSGGTHVALALFRHSQTTVVVRKLDHEPLHVVSNLSRTCPGPERDSSTSFWILQQSVFSNTAGDRPDVDDVLVLIVRGAGVDGVEAVAASLKASGIRIVTVALGTSERVLHQLRKLASRDDDARKLVVARVEHFPVLMPTFINVLCRTVDTAEDGSLRLVGGDQISGRLEVYLEDEWGTVCSRQWSTVNTRVSCKQLGFPDAVTWSTMPANQRISLSRRRRVALGDVTCVGNETRLMQCRQSASSFYQDDSCSDHVFIQCLCADCNDYEDDSTLRLVDGTSTSGRLEVFSLARRWTSVCWNNWTSANTRVACRQLQYKDGFAAYAGPSPGDGRTEVTGLDGVSCHGNETSLYECRYSLLLAACQQTVHVQCQCHSCQQLLLGGAGQTEASSGSTVEFRWTFRRRIDADLQLWFVSSKNPRLLLRRDRGDVITADDASGRRAGVRVVDDEVVLTLRNVSSADMGTYMLHAPTLGVYDLPAVLLVTDFAQTPPKVVYKYVNDSVRLSWDMSTLRRLTDAARFDVYVTTPTTGRLPYDYYAGHWLPVNGRSRSGGTTDWHDPLQPTIDVDRATVSDAGLYVVEVRVEWSSALTGGASQPWINDTTTFGCHLVVLDVPGTPSLLQITADDVDDDDEVTLVCRASAITSRPSQLAPQLQYLWTVDDQPLNETNDGNLSSIAVTSHSGLSYRCVTRELGSRLHSLPSNRLLMLPRLRRSNCDAYLLWAIASSVAFIFALIFVVMSCCRGQQRSAIYQAMRLTRKPDRERYEADTADTATPHRAGSDDNRETVYTINIQDEDNERLEDASYPLSPSQISHLQPTSSPQEQSEVQYENPCTTDNATQVL